MLRALLFSDDIDQVLMGNKWENEWNEHVWKQPAVRIWYQFLLRFEGLNDAVSTNFIIDLGEVLDMSTGSEEQSVREIMTRTRKLLTPVALNFGDIPSFINYLVACAGAASLNRKAMQPGAVGKAMMEGSKMLVALKHQNILLSVQAVERALRMAEQHLPSTKSGAHAGAKKVLKTGTDTQDADESAPSERSPVTQCRNSRKMGDHCPKYRTPSALQPF